jgi:hypothetical protein
LSRKVDLVAPKEAIMHAVVVRSTLHDIELGMTFLRDVGIPRLKQAPGFVTGHWVRLGEDGGTSMVVFESEDAAQAATEQLRTNPPPESAVTINSIEIGEVVEHA